MVLLRERSHSRTGEAGTGFRAAKPNRVVLTQIEEIVERAESEQPEDEERHSGAFRTAVAAHPHRHIHRARARSARKRSEAIRFRLLDGVILDYTEHLRRMTARSLLVYSVAMPVFLFALMYLIDAFTRGSGPVLLMLSGFVALTCGGLCVVAVAVMITAHLGYRDIRRVGRSINR